MKKILLLSPPFIPGYMRNARCDFVSLSKSNWYPIWLAHAGALLEKHRFKTLLLDAPAANMNQNETLMQIKNFEPDIVVIYTGRLSEDSDIQFAETIYKNHCSNILFVGPYFSINPKKTLGKSQLIHLGIQGEFEYPLLSYVQGSSPDTINNFLFKNGSSILENSISPYLSTKELDQIPFVSKYMLSQLNIKNYKVPSEKHPFIDIMTGRGCAYAKCDFCLWVHSFIKGPRYNLRSIDNVIEELTYISSYRPKIKTVMLQDDTLTPRRAELIADEIIRNNIKINWSCYMRPTKTITTDILKKMKTAGCINIHVGFESGDDTILKAISKGSTVEEILFFSNIAQKSGLKLHADFAFGFPGETRETAEKTLKLAQKINPYSAQFQIIIPFEGTPLEKKYSSLNYLENRTSPAFLSDEEIERFAKYAYKKFYISWRYLFKIMLHPIDYFFNRLDTYFWAIPALFWKRWIK